MITFRYHVVTLVAVFMAIGLGVLFGATFIDQNIVDGLEAAQARLGDRNQTLRGHIVDLERENQALQTFTGSTRDLVVRNSLRDVPIVLVTFESTPGDALDAVRETLTLAGARTVGQLDLSDRLDLRSEQNREALATVLGSTSRDPAVLSEALVAQRGTAVVGQNPEFLTRLLAAELASEPIALAADVVAPDDPPAVVMVGGGAAREINDRIAVPLARELGTRQTVTAAVENGTDIQLLKPIRDDSGLRVVTVDSIETPLGQSSLAIGLQGALGGQFGHYGRAGGATTALPILES